MSCNNSAEVKITTFINPHLFWVFETDNVPKRNELEKILGDTYPTIINKPQLEQFVLVKNTCYKRAIIKDIAANGVPEKFYCWLLDYGILCNTDKVYKIPDRISKASPMVKQAALNNVVCVQEVLGPSEKTLVESLYFTPGTSEFAKSQIKDASCIYFQCIRECNGAHLGTINIRSHTGEQYDLATFLIKEKLLAFNTSMFAQAFDINSNIANANYLKYLRTMSPQCSVGGHKDDLVCYLTTKSVGRAKSRRSSASLDLSADTDKHKDLQKWVEQTKSSNVSISESYESDNDSQMDSKLGNSIPSDFKTDSNVENGEPSYSISVSGRLPETTLEKLREIKNRHFSKNTNASICSSSGSRIFLDKTTDYSTDASVNVNIETDSQSSMSEEFHNQESSTPKKEVKTAESEKSPSIANTDCSSKSKVLSWGDFEDESSEKPKRQSVTHLLNIQPAGATYTSIVKKKLSTTPKESNLINKVDQLSKKLQQSAATVSNTNGYKPSDVPGQDITDVMHNIDPNMFCVCEQCKKWTDEIPHATTSTQGNKGFIRTPKKLAKPPLLLKTNEDKKQIVLVRSAMQDMEYRSAIMTDPNIIVHGTIFPLPVRSIGELAFSPVIHRFLHSFDQIYSIQSYIWPCLLRKMNACIVNTPKSGKTMGYLPVMCTYLSERKERYAELPTNTISPIVVILCPGTLVADEVYDLAVKMLDEADDRPSLALAVPPVDRACLNQFQKQCDLLVTTPITLVNLLHGRIITAKRFCHLVLEHTDVLLEKFHKEIDIIFNLCDTMLTHRNVNYSIQLVTLAERWTVSLENLIKAVRFTPLVCIGSHLEAALYGRVDIQMHFLESHAKQVKLCELIENQYEMCRTIIVCDNDEQVQEVKKTLDMISIKGIYVDSTMEKVEVEEMEVKWHATVGGKHLVFVCTDSVYSTILRITTAVILVHYGLPNTWTRFSLRFSCFLKHYHSPLNTNKEEDWIRCKTHIFLDETCIKQFPKLINLLTRMGCQLSTRFHKYYEASIKAREDRNISLAIPLCPRIKQFGECENIKCRRRHILSPNLDYSDDLPKNGRIKFKILRIRNVTSFTVKLIEHIDLDGKKHNCNKYPHLKKDLQEAMLLEKHGVYNAQLKLKYVWYNGSDQLYYRCVVRKIVKLERITKTATTVIVKLIDTGFDTTVCVADMYELPEQFKAIPAQGIDVYLANLVPPDCDEHFSNYSKNKITKLVNKALEDENSYCSGIILLQLCNTFWIQNMHIMEDLLSLNTIATRLNLSHDLLEYHLATKSESQLKALYNLCREAHIELPTFGNPKPVQGSPIKQATPQWAFLDEAEYNEVYMITVQTPAVFFVRLKKYHSLLLDFENNIQDALLKPFYPTCEVKVDQYYLAKDPGGDSFCRVKVNDIKDGMADCFYVDYGDYANVHIADIKFLFDEWIMKLPFQAIECRLYGVEPTFGDWESESIRIMDRYIFETDTDFFRTLYATTCNTEPPTATGGQKHAILLIDTFTRKNTVINKLLVDCGEAISIIGESIDVEFTQPEVYQNGIDDSKNDILEEIENKELTFEDVDKLQSKYGVPNNNESECHNGTEPVWDIEFNDKEAWIKKLLGVVDRTLPPRNNNEFFPPLKALPSPGYLTPNIEWLQNDVCLKLTVLLPAIEKYDLHLLRGASILFKTTCNENQYQFQIQLYDKVEMGQQVLTGLCLRITLKKCQQCTWPRLTLEKKRPWFIKIDHKQFLVPDEPKKPILSLGQVLPDGDELPGDNIMQYGSDGDSSGEDSISSGDF